LTVSPNGFPQTYFECNRLVVRRKQKPTADIQDRDGAKLLFEKVKECFPRLNLVWADGGYLIETD
jgi:short-subunit dehydrogenase involved in D-alanine esterification of teichoic acids